MATSSRPTNITGNHDPSSVFYIYPFDVTTSQLVSVKFSGNGFTNWRRSMMLTLSAKNNLGFVNGTIAKPEATSPDFVVWEKCNDLVISWIVYNLDENIAKSVLFLNTARDIWIDLEDRFGFVSITQVYSLEQKISEISQGNQSISEFYTSIKSVLDNLDDIHRMIYYNCGICSCEVNSKLLQK